MQHLFSSRDKKSIVETITRAELKTSGEIRVHIETYCPSSSLERAVFVFNQLKMYKTRDRNSALIYLASESRKFAVIGDTGINAVVPEGFWDSVKEIMKESFVTEGRFTEGDACRSGKDRCQTDPVFSYQPDDVNELPNDISFGS